MSDTTDTPIESLTETEVKQLQSCFASSMRTPSTASRIMEKLVRIVIVSSARIALLEAATTKTKPVYTEKTSSKDLNNI